MTGRDAMAMLHRNPLLLQAPVAKPDQRLLYLFAGSVLLHGLILALPASFENRASSSIKRQAIQAKIRVQVAHTITKVVSEPVQSEDRLIPRPVRETRFAPATDLRPARQPRISNTRTVAVPDPARAPSFNVEDLREQARALAKEPSNRIAGGVSSNRHASEKAPPDLVDRPMLETLSKSLGQPGHVMSEQIMNDGSRFVRFAGNTCLHIPRHLPFGRENEFTQTILLPTNCP